jgi:gingipain R
MGRYTPVDESGDMLIISSDGFTDEIANLAAWKTQSGIRTTIVNMTTVGSTDIDIKNYITTFYAANPNLVFVLLVGDHAQVPSHTYGLSGGEQLWSDSYYGQMTGGANDYYPELFVGRLSGASSNQITTQVNRILEYEKNPAAGDWMTKAIGLASDEGQGIGDDGEPDWQHARNIRTVLMNYGYTQVHEFYDGSHGGEDAAGNPNSTIILPSVNAGVGLFNYTGHGAENVCVTGNFSSTNVNTATNNGYYPFVISVACNNGTFTSGTCISEAWSWADNAGTPAGAIAACGSSILMAWAEPMQTQDEMAAIIAENYPTNKKATLGGLFYNSQMSVLEDYSNSTTAREVMQTWVMFGDPSVLFRNKVTMNMVVSHVSNVPLGTTSVVINCDIDGALVTIVQNGQIIGQGQASGGIATISSTALSSNLPLTVTAVKQNYKPYQGIITVADGPAGLEDALFEQLSIYPNPATDAITISWNAGLEVENVRILDVSGKEVSLATAIENGANLNIATLSSGMYIVRVETKSQSRSYRIVVQ